MIAIFSINFRSSSLDCAKKMLDISNAKRKTNRKDKINSLWMMNSNIMLVLTENVCFLSKTIQIVIIICIAFVSHCDFSPFFFSTDILKSSERRYKKNHSNGLKSDLINDKVKHIDLWLNQRRVHLFSFSRDFISLFRFLFISLKEHLLARHEATSEKWLSNGFLNQSFIVHICILHGKQSIENIHSLSKTQNEDGFLVESVFVRYYGLEGKLI